LSFQPRSDNALADDEQLDLENEKATDWADTTVDNELEYLNKLAAESLNEVDNIRTELLADADNDAVKSAIDGLDRMEKSMGSSINYSRDDDIFA